MKNLYEKALQKTMAEDGDLKSMVWMIGTAVVAVLIIIVFMVLAPTTAQDIWTKMVNFITSSFGI